ncbi:MAG: hypothetical protein F6K55_41310 [Moorea sp. SIO4A3]|nr:hypothetical protein [Moorena sp. SIO4A3]
MINIYIFYRQRSAVSGQRSVVSGQPSAISGQRSAVSGQLILFIGLTHLPPKSPNSGGL